MKIKSAVIFLFFLSSEGCIDTNAVAGRVTDLSAQQTDATTVKVTFTQPSSVPGCTLTGSDLKMNLERPISSRQFRRATTVTPGPSFESEGSLVTVVVSGLTPGNSYYFAHKGTGTGNCLMLRMSNTAVVVLTNAVAGRVTDLSAQQTDATTVKVTFTQPSSVPGCTLTGSDLK
ncbi:MAG: hypothetical protein ACI9BF_000771, partial [Candidatus Paceibacteria bacterium]